jgi:hypothetical protein
VSKNGFTIMRNGITPLPKAVPDDEEMFNNLPLTD